MWAISETWATSTGTLLFVLGGLGPFAASAVLVRVSGRYVRVQLREIFEARIVLRYYAFAPAFPVALFLGTAVIHVVVFDGVVTPDVLPGVIEYPLFLGFYLLQLVELSILLTWLTNQSDGRVLPAILLHAGANALLNYYPVEGVAGAATILGLGRLVTTLTVAVVALVTTAGTSLGADRPAR